MKKHNRPSRIHLNANTSISMLFPLVLGAFCIVSCGQNTHREPSDSSQALAWPANAKAIAATSKTWQVQFLGIQNASTAPRTANPNPNRTDITLRGTGSGNCVAVLLTSVLNEDRDSLEVWLNQIELASSGKRVPLLGIGSASDDTLAREGLSVVPSALLKAELGKREKGFALHWVFLLAPDIFKSLADAKAEVTVSGLLDLAPFPINMSVESPAKLLGVHDSLDGKPIPAFIKAPELGWKNIDDRCIHVTYGFPYLTDIEMDCKDIRIASYAGGVFKTTEDSWNPALETYRDGTPKEPLNLFVIKKAETFRPIWHIPDSDRNARNHAVYAAVGNKWTFVNTGTSFSVRGYVFRSTAKAATIEFTKEGVFIKGFKVVREADGKTLFPE